jgi:hypothetical protein
LSRIELFKSLQEQERLRPERERWEKERAEEWARERAQLAEEEQERIAARRAYEEAQRLKREACQADPVCRKARAEEERRFLASAALRKEMESDAWHLWLWKKFLPQLAEFALIFAGAVALVTIPEWGGAILYGIFFCLALVFAMLEESRRGLLLLAWLERNLDTVAGWFGSVARTYRRTKEFVRDTAELVAGFFYYRYHKHLCPFLVIEDGEGGEKI